MSQIDIAGIGRRFGPTVALDDVSLEVREGEFVSLLGPSGCGKTTLLNIVAGFLEPSSGRVSIGGKDVTRVPPYRRQIGMVFQNYALFPHLSVFDNIAYGLRVKRLPRARIDSRVREALALVQLDEFAARMPHQLSGGQQQRVAIARALATEPTVLLLDEPLSNLDAKLRKEMQTELRSLQRRVGITTMLVTHDQEEALTLSDRIGVLGNGRLQQLGTPEQVYRYPRNPFVAEFIGEANLLAVRATERGYVAPEYRGADQQPLALALPPSIRIDGAGELTRLMLRPERIRIGAPAGVALANTAHVRVTNVGYAGSALRIRAQLAGSGELLIEAPDPTFPSLPQPGDEFTVHWAAEDLVPIA